MDLFQRPWVLKTLLALLLSGTAIGGMILLTSNPGGLPPLPALALLAGTLGLGAWLGALARTRWIDQPRLLRAERRWAEGDHPYEVLQALGNPLWYRGELGYRTLLLKSALRFSLGYRDRAWLEALEAQLARLPLWKKWLAARGFQKVPGIIAILVSLLDNGLPMPKNLEVNKELLTS